MSLIQDAPLMAFNNQAAIAKSEHCGCYKCLQAFGKEQIKQWTDKGKTALCPHCGVDSVIPITLQQQPLLKEIHEEWFTKKSTSPGRQSGQNLP